MFRLDDAIRWVRITLKSTAKPTGRGKISSHVFFLEGGKKNYQKEKKRLVPRIRNQTDVES